MDKEKLQKEIVDAISQIAKNEARKNNKITIVKGEITGVDPLNCYYNFSYNNHLYSARSVLGGYSVGQKVFIAFSGEQENNIILCGEIIGGGTVASSEEKVLSSIVQQYYISNSSEIEPPQNPGEGAQYQWSDERLEPTKEAPYLWTRYKYTYTDASVEYSTPYVINVTEAINESNETITDYIDSSIGNIQSQLDKQADIWFYSGVPTLNTYPANEWTTDGIKDIHIGDLYFDTSETAGKAYEFKKDQSTYLWKLVQDQDVIKALNDAARAQDTADNKRRVFYSTPIPPYDKGDLWVQGSNGDILYCNTPKGSGATYSRSDWVVASKYTDDSNLNIFKEEYTHYKEDNDQKWENTLGKITTIEGQVEENTSSIQQTAEELSSSVSSITTTIGSLQDQIDGAIETYYLNGTPTLSNEPAVSWKDNETKDTHIGDLYYDKDTGYAYRFMKDGSTYTWVRISDEDISKAFAEAEKANKAAEKAQGDVNSLTEVVNENTTNIQQNSKQITLNAQETTKIKNDLSNNYYTKEQSDAAIKVSADAITSTVSDQISSIESNAIKTTVNYYLQNNGQTPSKTDPSWSTSQPSWVNGKHIWLKVKTTKIDGTISESNPVDLTGSTGATGANGQDGTDGIGIKTITNYYLASSSSSGITTSTSGWTDTIQLISSDKKYLWNYEKIVYTNNSNTLTDPCIIGTYGEKGENGTPGANGTNGVGISSITEYYQISSSNSTEPKSWLTSVPTLTPTNKYLWNYEKISYTNGTSSETKKRVIGVYGDKGQNGIDGTNGIGIVSVTQQYYQSDSGTQAPSGDAGWSTTQPDYAEGKYIWIRYDTLLDNGSHSYSTPTLDQNLNGVYETIKTTKSEILQTTDSISLKVESVQQKVEGIDISRTNLLVGTQDYTGWYVSGDVSFSLAPNVDGFKEASIMNTGSGRQTLLSGKWVGTLNAGEKYTLSFFSKSQTPYDIRVYAKGSNVTSSEGEATIVSQNFFVRFPADSTERKRSFTFTATTDAESNSIEISVPMEYSFQGVTIYALKLEKGDKATEWTPSYNEGYVVKAEIIASINNDYQSEIKIGANKISLEGITTVNNNFIIDKDGSLTARNAKFSGDIEGSTISGGTISGAVIKGTYIRGSEILFGDEGDYILLKRNNTANRLEITGTDDIKMTSTGQIELTSYYQSATNGGRSTLSLYNDQSGWNNQFQSAEMRVYPNQFNNSMPSGYYGNAYIDVTSSVSTYKGETISGYKFDLVSLMGGSSTNNVMITGQVTSSGGVGNRLLFQANNYLLEIGGFRSHSLYASGHTKIGFSCSESVDFWVAGDSRDNNILGLRNDGRAYARNGMRFGTIVNSYDTHAYSIQWDGSHAYLWVDATRVGQIV